MLLKIIPIIDTTLGLIGNINIADTDLQVVIVSQIQVVIN